MTTNLIIKGTHCRACKMLIEEVGSELPGVQSIIVDFKTGRTVIEHDDSFSLVDFTREVEALGDYTVETAD